MFAYNILLFLNTLLSNFRKLFIKNMLNTRIIKYLSPILMIIGILLFALVKFYFRKLEFDNNSIQFILGILPNFIFALFSSMTLASGYLKIKPEKIDRFDKNYKLLLIGIFTILIVEEYFPVFSGSKTSDIYDILSSLIGLIFGYIFYLFIRKFNHTELIKN